MKKLQVLLGLLICAIIFSCSTDNNSQETEINIDPIIGEWQFTRSVDFFNNTEFEFLADNCSSQSREIFRNDGTYGFTQFDTPNDDCVKGFFSTSGSWVNQNGTYQIEFEFTCLNNDCDNETRPSISIINNNTLRIQFNGEEMVNGEPTEFFFREYQRL